ncbi:MAG TPA: hypothetical protein VFG73_02505 [Rhodanobacteraceae bacterium]|nr:hypothetical protein [Rhodanobacteraceae bacterium]
MKSRKKPVVVEAFQMTKERRTSNAGWPKWLHEAWNAGVVHPAYPNSDGNGRLKVRTLEGDLLVDWDDWIIKGVKGEFYPCKPDIFAATYEAVEEGEPQATDAAPPLKVFEYNGELYAARDLAHAREVIAEYTTDDARELSEAELDAPQPEFDEDERETGGTTTVRQMLAEHGDEPGWLAGPNG